MLDILSIMTLTFRITSDDPDERVKLFRELTTGEDSDMDDADNIKAVFNNVMAQVLKCSAAITHAAEFRRTPCERRGKDF